ncbi:MAG: HDOD domain-containing protein [Candidatus Solibacter sp.]
MSMDPTVEQAHCRRTAALAVEVGRRTGVPLAPLEQAALLHHALDPFRQSSGLGRLAWQVVAGHDGRRIADIVQMCNLIDEQMEGLEFEFKETAAILDEIETFAVFEGFDPHLVDIVRTLRCGPLEFAALLPVEARMAGQVFRALRVEREYELEELETLALHDPSLAASLLRVANSALYGRPQRASTVARAIACIGVVASRKIMLGAAMRPVFASAGLAGIWTHSLSAAPFCSALAERTGLLTPEEGMLFGLVHDIGAIAIQFLPRESLKAHRNLLDGGCPTTYVERLLLGVDHGQIGAQLLAGWNFPEAFVEAVRFHHQPERSESALASMAFLAEFWSGLDEDIASFGRIDACLDRVGITLEALVELGRDDAVLRALKAVA